MRVLIIGSGGREHALVWKIAQSPRVTAILAAPGSDAIARQASCFPEIATNDIPGLVALARQQRVDLVVVGPEAPLAAGLADRLRDAGVATFGPSAAAARLEASKAFAKEFMARHGVPTAKFAVFDELQRARRYARECSGRCVVKADGLAAGKGVFVCDDAEQAELALEELMGERRFGAAGERVVIEERLSGVEASYYVISDGEGMVALAAAQDHKRALDGDRGENTGGMGAFSPTHALTSALEEHVIEKIVHPTLRGMEKEGHPYTGVLYVGLMLDAAAGPRVVEFNVRFGDPETQPMLVRMDGDLVPLLEGSARGELDFSTPMSWRAAALCVVLASGGYPRAFEVGKPIEGLDQAEHEPDVVVFHAGTELREDGTFVTAGGRVLGVTARADSVSLAARRAYEVANKISFEGMHMRRDIGASARGE